MKRIFILFLSVVFFASVFCPGAVGQRTVRVEFVNIGNCSYGECLLGLHKLETDEVGNVTDSKRYHDPWTEQIKSIDLEPGIYCLSLGCEIPVPGGSYINPVSGHVFEIKDKPRCIIMSESGGFERIPESK